MSPIDALRADIAHLLGVWGLYVAPVVLTMREELDPGEDDDAEQTAVWTRRLTLAMRRLDLGAQIAFHPDTLGEAYDAEVAKERRLESMAERSGARRGAVLGYERGYLDALTAEDARPGTPTMERARRAIEARGDGGFTVLVLGERALW